MKILTSHQTPTEEIEQLQFVLGLILWWVFQELAEALDSSVSVVINNFISSLLEQFDSWEALDLDLLQLIGGGVHLGDDNALGVLVFFSQFVPDWSKLFAVSTPWSIKFNEDILLGVHRNFVEVLSNEDLDSLLVPILGNLLRHQVLLQLALKEVSNEGLDIVSVELIILWLELGHLFSKSDGSPCGQFTVNNTEELQDSLVVFFVSVDSDEQHLALVCLGIFFQNCNLAVMVISGDGGEEKEVGLDFTGEDLLCGFVVEVNDEWKRFG